MNETLDRTQPETLLWAGGGGPTNYRAGLMRPNIAP